MTYLSDVRWKYKYIETSLCPRKAKGTMYFNPVSEKSLQKNSTHDSSHMTERKHLKFRQFSKRLFGKSIVRMEKASV